ncbi:LysR substrate-binding domain-containing protein [Microbulbifer taiwanensis]|uniref:LysR substrate-binding domain-containing protein n=1 Tax=Microbulbifer taiwanensis TaxID=986746 RepID=A0ABW1YLU8_9GAMM|nr:LysR substrate-binding domain-containing protein [Microbulbifer taiwanensis]
MIDLNDYFYFVHVVEKRGFSAAAKALDMPKSRLSRHIRQLEERLQTRLIQRTSRQFTVTDIGDEFYRYARNVVDEMEAAEAAVDRQRNQISGQVRISCSVGMAHFALRQLLSRFLLENPNVTVQQQVTNASVDLIGEGVDLALRGHMAPLPDSSLIQKPLARVQWHLFAGPAYIEGCGAPAQPEDLCRHRGLKVGWRPAAGLWSLQNSAGLTATVPFSPQLCSDDMNTLKQAASDGLGIVALPSYCCREEIKSGQLIRVLPDWIANSADISLLMPSRKGLAPAVRALADFLGREFPAAVGE